MRIIAAVTDPEFWLFVFCVLFLGAVFNSYHTQVQIEIPQGHVLCEEDDLMIILGGKQTYTPQEWDYIQRRTYEAIQLCSNK